MPDNTVLTPGFDISEGGESGYRALYPLTAVSLALGTVSGIAFVSSALLVVPILALLTGIWGWRAVSRAPDTWTGQRLAIAGVVLAMFFGGAAFARYSSRQAHLLAAADATAMEWFGYLAHNELHKANQLEIKPSKRLPIDENLWTAYKEDDKLNARLRDDVKLGGVRALLVLGERAHVRPCAVVSQNWHEGTDTIKRMFHVSFEQDGKLRSFFVELQLSRVIDRDTGIVGWKVGPLRAPVYPEGLGPKAVR
ncbi:MAG: hypothetical protein AB7O62_01470 [Pirellulales bacterium]